MPLFANCRAISGRGKEGTESGHELVPIQKVPKGTSGFPIQKCEKGPFLDRNELGLPGYLYNIHGPVSKKAEFQPVHGK